MIATARTAPLIPPPVQAATVRASILAVGDRRLEAETYLTEGYQLRQRIEKLGALPLAVIAYVWQPGRLKGIQVARDHGTAFLAATQVFDIRPTPRKWLALPRTHDVDERYVKHEWIVVTRSGSVGNAIMGYRAIEGMIISDDLLLLETTVPTKIRGQIKRRIGFGGEPYPTWVQEAQWRYGWGLSHLSSAPRRLQNSVLSSSRHHRDIGH